MKKHLIKRGEIKKAKITVKSGGGGCDGCGGCVHGDDAGGGDGCLG